MCVIQNWSYLQNSWIIPMQKYCAKTQLHNRKCLGERRSFENATQDKKES